MAGPSKEAIAYIKAQRALRVARDRVINSGVRTKQILARKIGALAKRLNASAKTQAKSIVARSALKAASRTYAKVGAAARKTVAAVSRPGRGVVSRGGFYNSNTKMVRSALANSNRGGVSGPRGGIGSIDN